ncbi:MAG: flagellar hook-associated protein FlgK, partial [Pseudomonadota bacterium]
TSHNIANINTDSYSRQRADFGTQTPEFSGGTWQGTGVKTLEVKRVYDEYLTRQLRNAQATTSETDTYSVQASRIDNLLADPTTGLDSTLQNFFNALHGVGANPTSIPARQVLLDDAKGLSDRFDYLQNQFVDAQARVNQGLTTGVEKVNALAKSIASLNTQVVVAQGQGSGQGASDLLDQRDQLLKNLSTYTNVSTLPQKDGSINVYMGQGQSLVLGNQANTLGVVPAANDPTQREIIYNNGTAKGQLIPSSQMTGGEIGGYLRVQNEVLVPAQNALGRMAQGLVADMNAQHQLGVDLSGNIGGLFFNAINTGQGIVNKNNTGTGTVDWQITDTNQLTTSDYKLAYDGSNYTLTRLSDHKTFTPPPTDPVTGNVTLDGVSFVVNGTPNAGDSFEIQPTRGAAGLMDVALGNPEEIAAASPINVVQGATNTGNGALSLPQITGVNTTPVDMTNDAITLTYSDMVVVNGGANAGTGVVGPSPIAPPQTAPIDMTKDAIVLTYDAAIPGYTTANNSAGGHAIWPQTLAYDPVIDAAGKTVSIQVYDPATTLPPLPGVVPLRTLSVQLSGTPLTNDTFTVQSDPKFTIVNNGVGGHVIWPQTLAYNSATDPSGKTVSLRVYDPTVTVPPPAGTLPLFNLTMQLTGTPQDALPDTFTIQNNFTTAPSDNRNALLLSGLQQSRRLIGGTATYQEANTQMVADVGSKTSYAKIDYDSQNAMLQQAQQARDSVSGVNLDEEAANLMRFQQAYQASAQVIKIASNLFTTLIGAVS